MRVCVQICEIDWAIMRLNKVPQKTPLFFSLGILVSQPTDSIIHHLQRPKQKSAENVAVFQL